MPILKKIILVYIICVSSVVVNFSAFASINVGAGLRNYGFSEPAYIESQDYPSFMACLKAIENNQVDEVKKLIEVNSRLIKEYHYVKYLAFLALQKENYEILELLFKHGCKVDIDNQLNKTLLMFAVESENLKMVNFLLDKGANINDYEDNGRTPLMFASKTGNLEMVKLLLKRGADLHRIIRAPYTKEHGYTPLYLAEKYGHQAVIDFLKDKGALSDFERRQYVNRFLEIVEKGNVDEVKTFLAEMPKHIKQGPQKEIKEREKELGYYYQFYSDDDFYYFQPFSLSSLSLDIPFTKKTALMIAAQQGNKDMVTFLLEYAKKQDEGKEFGYFDKREFDRCISAKDSEKRSAVTYAILGDVIDYLDILIAIARQKIRNYGILRNSIDCLDSLGAFARQDIHDGKAKLLTEYEDASIASPIFIDKTRSEIVDLLFEAGASKYPRFDEQNLLLSYVIASKNDELILSN